MRKFILLFLIVVSYRDIQAQHHIEFKIKGLRDTTLYLAHYFGESIVLVDSAKLDASGVAIFKGINSLPLGAYMLSVGKRERLTLVINDQRFLMETDTLNFYGNLTFKGSNDARIYHDFSRQMGEIGYQMADSSLSGNARVQMAKALNQRQKDFVEVNKGTFSAKLIKAGMEVELPALPNNPTKQDSINLEQYALNHYWDNFDLTDERMMYTPTVAEKLYSFLPFISQLKSVNIIKISEKIIDKTPVKSELRKYIASGFINYFKPNRTLGDDAIYLHLAEKYILNTTETSWDTASINFVRKDIAIKKPLLIGEKIPNVEMADTSGRYTALHGVKAQYTLLVIYDPECYDCQQTVEKLVGLSPKFSERGVSIYLACAVRDKTLWKEFIKTHKTEGFINGFDAFKANNFGKTFNITNFPAIFLTDKDKKILVNKRLELEEYLTLIDTK